MTPVTASDWIRFAVEKTLIPLAWPLLILAVVIMFRSQISDFLKRVIEIGPSGAKAAPPSKQVKQTVAAEEAAAGRTLQAQPAQLPPDPNIEVWEQDIRNTIQQHALADDPNLSDRLIRALAIATRDATFEVIYRIIFGSQLFLLNTLNTTFSMSFDVANDYFAMHQSRLPPGSNNTFDGWLNFLVVHRLISKNDEQRQIYLEVRGRQFLHFMVDRGLTTAKDY